MSCEGCDDLLCPSNFYDKRAPQLTRAEIENCPKRMSMQSTYLSDAMTPARRNLIIKASLEYLGPKVDQFDVIAARGMSGLLIAPVLAHLLNKPMLVVRKEGASHSAYKTAEGAVGRTYLIVDDFVCSGMTILTTMQEISELVALSLTYGPKFKLFLWKYAAVWHSESKKERFKWENYVHYPHDDICPHI